MYYTKLKTNKQTDLKTNNENLKPNLKSIIFFFYIQVNLIEKYVVFWKSEIVGFRISFFLLDNFSVLLLEMQFLYSFSVFQDI